MAIVSSIKYHNITNEYNEGANYFRRFLQYAENVSCGNMQIARTILDSLVVNKTSSTETVGSDIIAKEIKRELENLGYEVEEQVGQSEFKCSLAIKEQKQDEEYILSLLIDDDRHYNNTNLLEQYYQRPAILKAFGWRSMNVFARDWLEQPRKVIEQILKRIKEEPVQEETVYIPKLTEEGQTIDVVESPEERKVPPTEVFVLAGYEDVQFERLVFVDGNSNKFWEAAVQDNKLIVRYGRTGTKGQVQLKSFESNERAIKRRKS